MQAISSGAEATIYRKGDTILKERHPKAYRIAELDAELRRSRTRKEAKILQKIQGAAPKLIETDRESKITMEFIDAPAVKHLLDEQTAIAEEIGKSVAHLHDQDIIHGDLTTSNMLYDGQLHLIDFGLSFTSKSIEDKAVDIHLFRQALESKHHKIFTKAYRAFVKGYKESQNATAVLDRLKVVERRGRNKAKW